MQNMFYYQILPEKKLPIEYLIYCSKTPLKRGQVVKVLIKNSSSLGLVLTEASTVQVNQLEEIKEVSQILPLILSEKQINFLFALAYNTFNQPSEVLNGMLSPFKKLSNKFWQILKTHNSYKESNISSDVGSTSITKQVLKPEILLVENEDQMLFRIRYIIRSYISMNDKQASNYPLVFLFPEQKFLLNIKRKLDDFFKQLSLQVDVFDSIQSSQSQQTIINILTQTSQIIFGTRQVLFLPWQTSKLDLVLIDESNSFYIQDEKGLYYDTRDASFIFSQIFGAGLTFLTILPSVRLFNFSLKPSLETILSNTSKTSQKPLKIELLNRNFSRDNFFDLIDFLETSIIKNDSANLSNDQNNDINSNINFKN